MKIKDVRKSKIKLVEYLGEVEPAWTQGGILKLQQLEVKILQK